MNSDLSQTPHRHMIECPMLLEPTEYPLDGDATVVQIFHLGVSRASAFLWALMMSSARYCRLRTLSVLTERFESVASYF